MDSSTQMNEFEGFYSLMDLISWIIQKKFPLFRVAKDHDSYLLFWGKILWPHEPLRHEIFSKKFKKMKSMKNHINEIIEMNHF